jgi:hypothetical protein
MIKRTIEYHAHYLSDGTIPALTGFGHSVLTLDVRRDFLEIQGGQQQHANKHGDGGWQREKCRSYHAIRKNIGSHDLS